MQRARVSAAVDSDAVDIDDGSGNGVGDSESPGGETPRLHEIPFHMLDGRWTIISSGKWKRKEDISTLEGRTLVHGLKHLTRKVANFGGRFLIFSDSMAATLALTKGRSSQPGMLRVTRQWCALVLATTS